MKIKQLIIALLTCNSVACGHKNDALERALSTAGNNRAELEKVLQYYSHPADSLQLKAAKFLIAGMADRYGYYGPEINKSATVFSAIDSASYFKESMSNEDKAVIGDAIIREHGLPNTDDIEKITDNKLISATYLINNIDFSFKAWLNAPWKDKVSFDDFCEFILPYRIRNERLEYWRPSFYTDFSAMPRNASKPEDARSVYEHMNWSLNTETNFNVFFDKYFPFKQSIGDVIKGRIGSCETTSFYAATAMRSIGLPVAFDYIPHWGSTDSRHYMTHLIGNFGPVKLITNENAEEKTWHLVDFSSEFDENRHRFTAAELPPNLYIQYVRTIPKVYRYTFSKAPALAQINESVPEMYISPEFRNTNLKDVTDEYVTCTDVNITIKPGFEKYPVAYLCVFDLKGWQPVAISTIKNNSVSFKKMGRNTIYLPTVLDNGIHRPISLPFFIDSLQALHHMEANKKITQEMTLLRKYPLYSYTAYHAEILKGGRFEGANDSNFTHPEVLYQINHYPFFMNEATINTKGRFRYLRYVTPHDVNTEPDNIAGIAFYEHMDSLPLTGKFIGKEGIPGHEIAKAFDNNMDSYYQNAANRDGWIGLDLGSGKKSKVTAIRFCPRNDTNCIIPGNEYELFYWDGENWISLGVQKASSYTLQYHKMPSDGLFWLRCNSGGKEERIFTYSNGKQIWW